MTNLELLKERLLAFSGSEEFYRHWTKLMVFTEGIKYLADEVGAYWLIDLTASYQTEHSDVPFQLWSIRKNSDDTAIVEMREDSGKPALVKQELQYTDLPFEELEWYVCLNDDMPTMLLKNEY